MARLGKLLKRSIDALLAPAPDPRFAYADVYQRQRLLLAEIRQALTQMERTKGALHARTQTAAVTLDRLLGEARTSLAAGRDDLARVALQRRQALMGEMQAVERQLAEVAQEAQRLAVVAQRLAARIEALQARRELIEARYAAAEAQVRIQEALSGVSDELHGVGIDLERAELQTDRLQARARALDRLVELGAITSLGGALLDPSALWMTSEDANAAVEAQLAALKRELSGQPGDAVAGRS
jgi:phage shock protein A